jgi:hypothetical protein
MYRIRSCPTVEEIEDGIVFRPCYLALVRCLNFDPANTEYFRHSLLIGESLIDWVYDTHDEPTEFSFQEAKTIIDYLESLYIDATLEEVKEYAN